MLQIHQLEADIGKIKSLAGVREVDCSVHIERQKHVPSIRDVIARSGAF